MTRLTRRARTLALLGAAGLAGVVVALGAAAGPGDLLTGGSGGGMPARGPGAEPTASAPPSGVPVAQSASGGSADHDWSVLGVVLAIMVVLIAVWLLTALVKALLRRGRRPRAEQPLELELDVLADPARVAAEVSRTAAEQRRLLAAGEPRDAVVACWLAFEATAERAGVPRRAWETSTEFTVRLLGLVHADPEAVAQLAALYGEARFSTHPMGEAERAAARSALDAIQGSLDPVGTP